MSARSTLLAAVLLGAACSDSAPTSKNSGPPDPAIPSTTSTDASTPSAGSGSGRSDASAAGSSGRGASAAGSGAHDTSADGGSPDASTDDPCSPDALRDPRASTTYYVAIDEPGASNDGCDGLAPRDEGSGHCPFRDFSSARTRSLLDGVADTRVDVRAGTYVISGWEGLRITGTGTSEAERVVLSAYPGEQPVLDVGAPDGQGCTDAATAMADPKCVREVLRISGQYTLVQGITVQNGLAYHAEITGSGHHRFECNTLHETVVFPQRSDLVKIDAGARDVQVRHNDFSRFRSQAIDMTGVQDVLIEDNEFHDPIDDDAGATGTKLGSRGIIVRNNRVHDMGASKMMHAFSFGGTGTLGFDHDHTAYELQLVGNQVWNIAGIMVQLVSCENCTIEDNRLWNAGAGILLSAAATGSDQCGAGASGCGPSSGTRIRGNRMRALDGGGDAKQANVFVFAEPGESSGLDASDNLYCAPSADDARFGSGGTLVDFAAWQAATGTDGASATAAQSDPRCTF